MSTKISELLDGQLNAEEVKQTLHAVAADPALRDRYTIYGLVGDAVRGNSTPDDGFTLRILARMNEQQVQIEPAYDPLAEQ